MEDTSKIEIGQYVKSTSGRDKENIFIVYEIIDDNKLKIVDGDLRKVSNPKVKNIKHIQAINKVSRVINEKITNSNKITNLLIKQEIIKFGLK